MWASRLHRPPASPLGKAVRVGRKNGEHQAFAASLKHCAQSGIIVYGMTHNILAIDHYYFLWKLKKLLFLRLPSIVLKIYI
jgi:hypothetical protein